MNAYLHIVCLDAPAPPDYGGAIDMYHKIKALSQSGRKIILHYFNYKKNRGIGDLEKFCEEIYAYERKGFLSAVTSLLPYIVASRISQKLIDRLNRDAHPILLEGLHCSGILPFIKNKQRSIVCRVHNNEAAYYRQLKQFETNYFRKLYFSSESKRLERYQNQLDRNLQLACISEDDKNYFLQQGFTRSSFVPAFLPWQEISAKTGLGNYCLYQGNLSVSENVKAVEWLAKNVFQDQSFPLIVAGKCFQSSLKEMLSVFQNITVIENPSDEEMAQLIEDAHLHVLPSFNTTGVKLKLLHALHKGRFCLTNKAGVAGSGMESAVLQAETAQEFQQVIKKHLSLTFDEKEKDRRREILKTYNNALNAETLSASLL